MWISTFNSEVRTGIFKRNKRMEWTLERLADDAWLIKRGEFRMKLNLEQIQELRHAKPRGEYCDLLDEYFDDSGIIKKE